MAPRPWSTSRAARATWGASLFVAAVGLGSASPARAQACGDAEDTRCASLVAPAGDPFPTLERALARVMGTVGTGKPAVAATDDAVHHLAWALTDVRSLDLASYDGGPTVQSPSVRRWIDVDVRAGNARIDSMHKLRDGWVDDGRRAATAPLDDVGRPLEDLLVVATDDAYRAARKRLLSVRANARVKVAREDTSDDWSAAPVVRHDVPTPALEVDVATWSPRVAAAGRALAAGAGVHASGVSLSATHAERWFLDSAGTRIHDGRVHLRLSAWAATTAEDGMNLSAYDYVDVASPDHLPDAAATEALVNGVLAKLQGLRVAPPVEPYSGPAILRGRAAGVFFHEIFGHRVEGHRQKDEDEGQTFTKRVGLPILPAFLDVTDDPTLARLGTTDLNGHYVFDDEGVAAQRVPLVEKGILRNFLMSRAPIAGFGTSNGHGRREPGNTPVSRQGNLMVTSSQTVPYARLREQLVAETKRQGKPFGLVFDDISGGFTFTGRSTPNAFAVQPVTVWKVYADGRPDELVRGVDLIGTPLTTFSRILAAADDRDVFNGVCGAESGWVPVSASAPSLLVSEVEVQRQEKGNDRPPILPPPSPATTGGVQ